MKFLSGIRPTGNLHIGNYFGAVVQFVEFQKEHDGLIMIADLHAMDTELDPKILRKNILTLTASYLAAGLDPEKNILFQQSAIPEHTELARIFSTIVNMGTLERMTQYKDKGDGKDNVPVGLFTYPLLMASDILLYDVDTVPVGHDQKQHVELTRDIAERFNSKFGDTFTIPKVQMKETGARIMGLDNPEKKMSKSALSDKNYIMIDEDPDSIRKKIMSSVTDSKGVVAYAEDQPGVKNLLDIMSLSTGRDVETLAAEFEGKGYGDFKSAVADAIVDHLSPLREKIKEYMKDEARLIKIIEDGTGRARDIAQKKLSEVKQHTGLKL